MAGGPAETVVEPEDKEACQQCGAKLAPGLRYCVACYHAVSESGSVASHKRSAQAVSGSRRADPTVVFLPEVHEALLRRQARRKRLALFTGILLLLIAAGVAGWLLFIRESADAKRALAREHMAQRELNMLADALERFKQDVGRYPTDREGIGSLRVKPLALNPNEATQLSYWSGPYIEIVLEVDPWGNDYVYRMTGDGEGFELFSPGPGGEESGNVHLRVTSHN